MGRTLSGRLGGAYRMGSQVRSQRVVPRPAQSLTPNADSSSNAFTTPAGPTRATTSASPIQPASARMNSPAAGRDAGLTSPRGDSAAIGSLRGKPGARGARGEGTTTP